MQLIHSTSNLHGIHNLTAPISAPKPSFPNHHHHQYHTMAVLISVCQFPTINQFHSKAVSFSSSVITDLGIYRAPMSSSVAASTQHFSLHTHQPQQGPCPQFNHKQLHRASPLSAGFSARAITATLPPSPFPLKQSPSGFLNDITQAEMGTN
jgi:hypothetical protein